MRLPAEVQKFRNPGTKERRIQHGLDVQTGLGSLKARGVLRLNTQEGLPGPQTVSQVLSVHTSHVHAEFIVISSGSVLPTKYHSSVYLKPEPFEVWGCQDINPKTGL